MKKLAFLLVVIMLLCCLTLTACEENIEEDILTNYYYGGDTFSIAKWYSGVTDDVFDITVDEEGVTTVDYSKPYGSSYPQIVSVTSGDIAHFNYFNITIKSSTANCSVMIQAPLTYGTTEDEVSLVFDTTQTLEMEYTTYSIAIPKGYRPQLNHMDGVWIFPQPGSSGTGVSGTITIEESYFSVAVPEDTVLIDSSTSSGDTPVYRYGSDYQWSNEYTWTNYSPSTNDYGEIDIYFNGVAEYAPLIRKLADFTLDNKTIEFTFVNEVRSEDYSIDEIVFYLRGDKKEWVEPDTGYAYWSYYEYQIGTYYLETDGVDNEDGRVTVTLDVSTAKYTLTDHMDDGVSLVLFIESRPTVHGEPRIYDCIGKMQVVSVVLG